MSDKTQVSAAAPRRQPEQIVRELLAVRSIAQPRFDVPADRLVQDWKAAYERAIAYLETLRVPDAEGAELAGEAIERRRGLSASEFLAGYAGRSKPVIVTDALDNCAALSRWTPAFFRERYGHLPLNVKGSTSPLP